LPDVTILLAAVRSGDPDAANRLMRLIYDELHCLATAQMRREAPENSLSPSGLINEAYLRLRGVQEELPFENRRHFFGAAANAMRRILVDAARSRQRAKRGGALKRVECDDFAASPDDDQLIALDESLSLLAETDATAAQVVELYHFAGLTYEQTAEALETTVYEVRQKWTYARAWLRDALS
jgi:RNA polymerase sigma factor (TIGR02999 family)